MKTLLSFLLLVVTSTLHAQTIQTLTFPTVPGGGPARQQDIPVLAGETLEILAFLTINTGVVLKVNEVAFSTQGGEGTPKAYQGLTFAGPITVSLVVQSGAQLVFTYKTTTVASVATQNIPSQTVAIPENTIAPADVILESSTDLNVWSSALPGSFAPSILKRFYRLRLVLH